MQWLAQNWMGIVLAQILVTMYARLTKREERNAIAQFGDGYRQTIQEVPTAISHLPGKRASGTKHHGKQNHG
jgi:protein-S-isoprenylcysteine O-methyltransferase Ste14